METTLGVALAESDIDDFCDKLRVKLTAVIKSFSENYTISDDLQRHLRKRIPPRSVRKLSNPSGLAEVFIDEVDSIGLRIRRYQYIGLYKDSFKSNDIDIGLAFTAHLHDMRPGELYIILERASDLLKFGSALAKSLGLIGEDKSRSFEKAFKKSLERRLRERHRIVHAHERRSLTSRIVELSEPKTDEERDIILDALSDMVVDATKMIAKLRRQSADDALQFIIEGEFRKIHLDGFVEESIEMWRIFTENLEASFE